MRQREQVVRSWQVRYPERVDGSAIATENDDADAFTRGAERGAVALAEAMRCKTYRERWAWIGGYMESLDLGGGVVMPDDGYEFGDASCRAANEESDR